MKKTILFLATLLILSIAWHYYYYSSKTTIGVLDVNKVLATIPQIKNMQTDLKKKFDPRSKDVINLQNNLRKDITKYRQNNTTLKGNALKYQQQKLINENKKLQETKLSLQKDLIAAQNKILQPVLKEIENIANDIAEKRKMDLIVTKTSTVFNKPKFEITDQVIAEMNKNAAKKR